VLSALFIRGPADSPVAAATRTPDPAGGALPGAGSAAEPQAAGADTPAAHLQCAVTVPHPGH
jgi:hypothetical protein